MIDPCVTCWRRCSHPHTHHTLACRSTGKDELSRYWHWSDTHMLTRWLPRLRARTLSGSLARFFPHALARFLLASQAYFSFSSPSLAFFRPAFFRPRFPSPPLSSHRTYLPFVLNLWAVSTGAVRPKLTLPQLRTVTMTTRAPSKRRASELAKERC